ncbi:MAG: SDH family Clp fold serine proteinase [Thermoplasmata archaeon]
MEVVHGLKSKSVDLVLHSPGGSAEATEAVVLYLRSKFDDIRVIVPQGAMSAATMLACSGDRIVLARHSFLGPIDPQRATGGTPAYASAQAILDKFELAKTECSEDANVAPWWPILSQYGPALLIQCRNQLKLSRELVQRWLKAYPFKHHPRAGQEARSVASALADHRRHMSHGRHLGRDELRKIGGCGLVIEDLEKDQVFQDLVLSVFHSTMITFSATAAVKIVENNSGRAFIKLQMTMIGGPRLVPTQPGGPPPTPLPSPVSPPAAPAPAGPATPKP